MTVLKLIEITDKNGVVVAKAELDVTDAVFATKWLNEAVLTNPSILGIGLVGSVQSLLGAESRDGTRYTILQVSSDKAVHPHKEST